jgi:hypothetical protein
VDVIHVSNAFSPAIDLAIQVSICECGPLRHEQKKIKHGPDEESKTGGRAVELKRLIEFHR